MIEVTTCCFLIAGMIWWAIKHERKKEQSED